MQAPRRKRIGDLIQVLDSELKKPLQPAMDMRGLVNARVWGQYDTYQGWFIGALNRRALAATTLESAKALLAKDRIDDAHQYADLASKYYITSGDLNSAATAVLTHQVVKSSLVLETTYRASSEALKYGVAIVSGPSSPAYDAVDFVITAADFGVDYGLEGLDTAQRNLMKKSVTEVIVHFAPLPLQSDGTQLLGKSGLYENLAKATSNPDFSKEIMSALGRSGIVLTDDLKKAAAKDVLDGLSTFASKAADPDVPAFSSQSAPKKTAGKH
jgi:hypothetical protein